MVSYGVREFDAVTDSFDPVFALVCGGYDAIAMAGEAVARLQGWRSAAGPKLDLLDDDGVGQPGEHAGLHHERSAQAVDAEADTVVR